MPGIRPGHFQLQRDKTSQDAVKRERKPRRNVGVYNRVFTTPKGLDFDERRDRFCGLLEKGGPLLRAAQRQ
jgi:hypothetical protein